MITITVDNFYEIEQLKRYVECIHSRYETARSILDANIDDLFKIDGLSEDKIEGFNPITIGLKLKEMMQRELEEAENEFCMKSSTLHNAIEEEHSKWLREMSTLKLKYCSATDTFLRPIIGG